ncbi:hypothetical protein [Vitiosangium sp. GDMCC 1.1324]|uniref:hypothetical protein n=1 Tax=Vitiosangium sp. (strain GDMCC 1.1324) TaxID=2138576 RepID=UPI000D3C0910|nr:hypothetical protein [Vitiosangium sp. GDMCC 1.1324]PTL82236.1 hypothetical protein DAT35_20825 [Vitiosangium sp. GDMCC 1.1324]
MSVTLWPVAPTLEAIRPFVADCLVGARAWSDILAVATRLPEGTVCYNLECRLAEGQQRVDLLAVVRRGEGARVYAGRAPRRTPRPELFRDERWRRIRRLFTSWVDGALERLSPNIWLEFDLDGGGIRVPVPQLGICIDPCMYEPDAHRPPVTSEAFRGPTEAAIELLRGKPLTRAMRERVRTCIAEAEQPPEGRAIFLGITNSRSPNVLRLWSRLKVETVPAYLERIGWKGPGERVCFVLDRLCRPRKGLVKLEVELQGEELSPRFGVCTEFCPEGDYREAWRLLSGLVNLGQCTPEKREALQAWPGTARAALAPGAWPVRIHRMVDFKFVVWPDGTLETKAYLMVVPLFSLL